MGKFLDLDGLRHLWDKIKSYVAQNGIPGPQGPDGNPTGTVISFMGTTAPEGYLACDGTAHSIEDYPGLASFFEAQFGSKNYFGGNGTTTFAVPDLRNLFLRGYHGSATALSGNIGKKQEATEILNVAIGSANGINTFGAGGTIACTKNMDSKVSNGQSKVRGTSGTVGNYSSSTQGPNNNTYFTARPVNMAVL